MQNPLMLASPHKSRNSCQSNKYDGKIFKVPEINIILFFFLSYGKTAQGSILLGNCNVPNFIAVNSS